ncbi:Gef1p KNAG_0I00380 [Huiozyma naganishii CBS 8797]|uniref:CBS domain-containing protein n=1 Tax=Huiozyma naganishii (strain ATCC MYA-139 / BCRC 22969 / CBS 8797 / KCTC 17520 / NBRC 10181 / NCYC 3082 / Yp74L-3) TaxID=1071383 RepID=J7S8Z6_HUIN7|nr:hypothetical protein KNAG_0I00380 [Kazachstania naganishii CBS 8797]CCK71829.1 hypothetical protein KNAG_0I00380 [Kazachstania naganishii CBS 8797]
MSSVVNAPVEESDPTKMYNREKIAETQNLDQFLTIDRIAEEQIPVLSAVLHPREARFYDVDDLERHVLNSRYQFYRSVLWNRSRQFITLTAMAVAIGFFAAFVQIFTETLVNWKSGHCQRNFLLNKSFCCAVVDPFPDAKVSAPTFQRRNDWQCVDEGVWIEWSGAVAPFFIFTTLSVLFALISTLLVKYVAPMATGSGISEIKVWVSGFEYKSEFLSGITLLVKSVALPLAISSGLSLGKEGPSVHYATCCGYVVSKWILRDKLTYKRQFEYLTAAGGAGVAVAFGAPIGGVLFGLEELSSATDFNTDALWKSYYVALIAVTTLKCINPFRNGKIILFNVSYDKNWKIAEIPVFIALGVFGGLYGKYISKLNISYVNFRKRYLSSWPIQEVVILALVTALLSYFNEFLKLDMTESMGILFHECTSNDHSSPFAHRLCFLDEHTHVLSFLQTFLSLCFATFVRAALVIVSYGARVPAGIFVPSMAVGATFGRAVSLFVERFISGTNTITPGAYAFLGAAGTLCGITNLTLTVVVIMLELTGAFIYIIPTMLVVAITRIIMNFSGTNGISDQMIIVNGYPILEQEEVESPNEGFMEDYCAGQIMSSDLIVLRETMRVSELESLIYESNHSQPVVNGFPIVRGETGKSGDERICIGYVLRRHIMKKLIQQDTTSNDSHTTLVHFSKEFTEETASELSFADIVNSSPVTVKPDISCAMLYRMFQHLGCKAIMVEAKGFLQGILTSKDIIKFERYLSRERCGPRYKFNDALDQQVWSFIHPIIRRFSRMGSGGS